MSALTRMLPFLTVLGLILAVAPSFVTAEPIVGIAPVGYRLVSIRGVDHAQVDLVFKVVARNGTTEFAANVAGVTSSTSAAIRVIDGDATFGDIPSLSNGLSTDTITVRRNLKLPFEYYRQCLKKPIDCTVKAALRWDFSGVLLSEPLPPDPGAAGNISLEGVDSNDNGVRDDLERFIAINYSDSERMRLALSELAAGLQKTLDARASKSAALEQSKIVFRAIECIGAIDPERQESAVMAVSRQFTNTWDRLRAHSEFDQHLAGEVLSEAPTGVAACNFDTTEFQN